MVKSLIGFGMTLILFCNITLVKMQMEGWYVGTIDNQKFFWTFPSAEDFLQVQDRCSFMHMQLARIESKEENNLIVDYLIKQGNFTPPSSRQFWLGGTDLFNEGEWHWHNNFKGMDYTNWYSGQAPTNFSKNCMTIHMSGLWFDRECSYGNEFYFPLCETYSIHPPLMNNQFNEVPKKGIITKMEHKDFEIKNLSPIGQANGKYFWIDEELNEYHTSNIWDFCQSKGLRTVSIESREEIDLIVEYLYEHHLYNLQFATSAVSYYEDFYYWMKNGKKIENSSYIEVGIPEIGVRYLSLCIRAWEHIPVQRCILVGQMSTAICEIDL